MRWRARTDTPAGSLHTIRRRDVAVHRVGYSPDPWNWTPWEYAGTDGRFHGRWDDPNGTWRTLYAGFSPLACYLEVLAVFRADPVVSRGTRRDHRQRQLRRPAIPPRPQVVCRDRGVRQGCSPPGGSRESFAVPGHPESLPTLRVRFLNEAKAFGLADLDAAAIRDSRPRALTQAISAWIYTLSSADGTPISGIEFASRHGDNLTLWALYERDTTTSAPPQVTAVGADPVNVDHPDLQEAMRLHRLTWSD